MTTAKELLDLWNTQQTAFIEFRDLRTRCMLDLLASLPASKNYPFRILDLGCGPGSVSNAVLARFPNANVVGIDRYPILLKIASEATPYPERFTAIDADLSEDWRTKIPEGPYDAAVSATALHWLTPDNLVNLYLDLAEILTPGGVLLNADHLLFDAFEQPFLNKVAAEQRANFEKEELARGVMGWEEWFKLALDIPGWEAEAAKQRSRMSAETKIIKVSTEFHQAALRAAGFNETGQIWQWMDDRITYGRLPESPIEATSTKH